jgi:hypothetical protein
MSMESTRTGTMNRRLAIGGLAGAVGLAWPGAQRGRTIIQRGVAGGGVVKFEQGEASFSLGASRVIIDGEEPGVVLGGVRWVDAGAGLNLSSVEITDYQDLEIPDEQGEARRIVGTMSVEGDAEYPFELDVIDTGEPGSGRDTVFLRLGAAVEGDERATPTESGGFRYRADGILVAGDIQHGDFEITEVDGQFNVATPVE